MIWYKVLFKIRVYFTGNQEEGLIEVYLPHWDISWCGCRSSWCPGQSRLWVLSWWGVHRILVSWSHVWESTCHTFFIMPTFQCWSPCVRQDQSGRIMNLWLIFILCWGFRRFILIHNWCNHLCEVFCDILHFLIKILPVVFNHILNDY